MTDKTSLGDRMKMYESPSTSRKAFKGQPIVVRLDGKSFHSFCKGLKRPFDSRLSELMVETTKFLVDRFNATVGYTQSDEITLVFFIDSSSTAEYVFDGRMQKMDSLFAASATAYFNTHLSFYLPEKEGLMPIFDCRSFVVPNILEAYHSVLWRQQDCTKNAVSMAAQSMFSHKSLQGQNTSQMQERMWAEQNVNFNDYPATFRRGTFARRVKVLQSLDADTAAKLEALGHRVPVTVERTMIETSNAWLSRLDDAVSYLFKGGPETYRTATGGLIDGTGIVVDKILD